ncbi:MAG: TolC family protein [Bacteroidota bacterium]
MNKLLLTLLFFFNCFYGFSQTTYSLAEIIDRAKEQSPVSKQAETRLETRFWQYRLFKANYNPQLALTGNLPGYNRDFLQNRLDDGTISFINREQTSSSLNLGLFQPIAWTGGNISLNSRIRQFNDLNQDITQWNSTPLDVSWNQPLFAYNQLRWNKKIQPLRYEESKRSYVEELELVSRTAVSRFFDYLDAQVNLEIAQFNLANNDTIFLIEKGRYNIGTTSEDKLLQIELQLLRSKQDVTQARLNLQTSRLELQTYIGLNEDVAFKLDLPEVIPEFIVMEEDALTYAIKNRADYLAFERRRLEADSEVARAKGARFQMDLNASFGLNSAGSTFDDSYMDLNNQQVFNVSLNVPIVNWGRNEARMKTALANKQLTDYVIDQEKQSFELEVLTQVRQLEVLKQQINISGKSDEIAQKRYEVAQNRYLIGKIDITNLNIALTEKDTAKRSYLNALRDFWVAYYNLRKLTLYDFVNSRLLYTAEE